jgi:IS6 family transposase
VDSQGHTLEFRLSPTRDAEAAKRFFSKTLAAPHTTTPRVITVDKNAAYPKAFIKRRVNPGLGFFSFATAWHTLQGYEVMNMGRKGQMRGVEKGDILGQVAFIASLFGVAV